MQSRLFNRSRRALASIGAGPSSEAVVEDGGLAGYYYLFK